MVKPLTRGSYFILNFEHFYAISMVSKSIRTCRIVAHLLNDLKFKQGAMKGLYPLLGPVYMEVGDPRYRSGNPLRWGKIAGQISKLFQEFKTLYESEILKAFKSGGHSHQWETERGVIQFLTIHRTEKDGGRLYILYTTIPLEPNTAN